VGSRLLQVVGQAAGTVTVTASYTQRFRPTPIRRKLTSQRSHPTQTRPSASRHLHPSVKVNGTQQFHAYATYDNGTETEVTNDTGCSWTTSDGTLATLPLRERRRPRSHFRRWQRRPCHGLAPTPTTSHPVTINGHHTAASASQPTDRDRPVLQRPVGDRSSEQSSRWAEPNLRGHGLL